MFEHDLTNVAVARQMSEVSTDQWLTRLLANVRGPVPIISGPAMAGTREGVPRARVVGDDPVLLEKTKHVRKQKEVMGQFYARTGLGAAQIRTMSREEIAHFVDAVTANPDYQERAAEALSFEPKLQRARFNLDEPPSRFLLT